MAFIQGQGASNSSSSSTASTAGTSSQQQADAHKLNNNMDSSESTPNLTHATRVSPATVSPESRTVNGKTGQIFPPLVCVCVKKKNVFHFLFFLPHQLVCAIFFPLWKRKKKSTLTSKSISCVSSLSDFTQQ